MKDLGWYVRAGVAVVALVVPTYGGAPADAVTASAGDDYDGVSEPRVGGTLKVASSTGPSSLDPAKLSVQNFSSWSSPLFDSLLRVDARTGEVGPGLARSLTTEDGVVWTLTLRPGLEFSDGTSLDAAAVKFNWDRSKSTPEFATYSTTSQIVSNEVVDPETLEITLEAANGSFVQEVASRLGVIGSPEDIQAQGSTYGNPGTKPVGAGPFILTSWIPDGEAVFERNPNYWNAPRPYIDRLEFQPNTDDETNYTSVTTGQNHVTTSAGTDMTQRATDAGLGTYAVPDQSLGAFTFYLNLGREPFNDIRARQALNHAIDPELVNELMWSGQGTLTDTLWTTNSPYYDESLTVPEFDPEEAQALFDAVAEDTGKPLEFRIQEHSGRQPSIAEVLITLLGSYQNVSPTIQLTPGGAAFTSLIGSGDWEVIQGGTPFNRFEPEPYLSRYVHSTGTNFAAGYSDPVQDELIEAAKEAFTSDDRTEAYHAYARHSLENVYQLNIGVASPDLVFIFDESVIKGMSLWQGGFDYDTMWLEES